MPLSINTNIANLAAQRALNYAENQAQVSMQRLATGHRINSAKDDSAGLAVANQIASRIMGMKAGIQNLTSAVSALQIAEGGMVSIEEQLQLTNRRYIQSRPSAWARARATTAIYLANIRIQSRFKFWLLPDQD